VLDLLGVRMVVWMFGGGGGGVLVLALAHAIDVASYPLISQVHCHGQCV
jgi:hypothetical protein